ncbi:polynucleotide adenylyltransferase [Halomonas sp. 707D7]|uniref:polynucleotide adenylyltransferase n=1 Tax=Halomonas sp. 707D7 TaxID=1681044 RepID=UPI00209EC4A5|nr:polynucleotide adenylyltransferase [Halomonas sp. 707D7]MCP1315805.1 polynucleotide adenylyltransferase [Halomonas sp. 707D7]
MAGGDTVLDGLEVYRVGGAVRDELLGWPVFDNDWVVVGTTADEMARRGFKPVGRDFPVFLHPQSLEEYALARTERKAGRGYTGFEVHASPEVTLEEDLSRRDLTINAIAQAPGGALVDPFDGQADIARRLLRHVSPAFGEDPLRVLRTARFLARYAGLGFRIADETLALMQDMSARGELDHLAAERVWVETEKALKEPTPEHYFHALKACDALESWWPGLAARLEAALALLPRAPSSHAPLEHWRMALLASALDEAGREALIARLRLPNAVAALCRQVALTRALVAAPLDAETVFGWLERLDAFRKPEQVAAQLALVETLTPERAPLLARAFESVREVNPQALMAEGLSGGELGRALRTRREAAVAAAVERG